MKQLTMETTILKGKEVTQQHYEIGLIPDAKNFEMEVINLYPQKSYQTIEGFGAALTESAGYALSRMSGKILIGWCRPVMERAGLATRWAGYIWTAAIFHWKTTALSATPMIPGLGISAWSGTPDMYSLW